jgi:hypothetical protein
MDMVDVFFAAAVYYYSGLAYNWHNLKAKKEMLEMRLSCRRQRINDKLQHIGEAYHGLGDERKKFLFF